ncbi:MAG: hypothetical protein WC548_00010 [Candidatus Pacearchaeota archaeon]
MKLVYKIDVAILVFSLIGLIFVFGYVTPLVISPANNFETGESEILFLIERADVLLIDDNVDFTTPDEYRLEDGLKINFVPGKYYWKAEGILKSEIRTLTIKSEVNLELRKFDGVNYGVYNAGNVRLDVEVYNGTSLIERKKLDIEKYLESDGNKFVGESDE